MIRKYNNIVAVPYLSTTGRVQGYVASRYVPYLIDYGYSCVNIGGVGFGKIGLESYGVTSEPFPMYDTYKIIGFLSERVYSSKHISVSGSNTRIIARILDRLFYFFNEGSVRDRVITRLNNKSDYYSFSPKHRSITHDAYLSWLESKSGVTLPIHKNLQPLTARGIFTAPINTNIDTCEFYNLIGSQSGPETSLEYCEVVAAVKADETLSHTDKEEFLSWLVFRFNAEDYFNESLPMINAEILDANELKAGNLVGEDIIVHEISKSGDIATEDFMNTYKSHVLALLRIKEIASHLMSYIRASICSLTIQGKIRQYTKTLGELNVILADMVNFINNNRQIVKTNVDYAETIIFRSLTKDKKVIEFWTSEHEILYLAI